MAANRTPESELLARAAAFPGYPTLSQLTLEALQELSRNEGVDFATAVLYHRVRHAPQHAEFIERVDRAGVPTVTSGENWIVGIVPAAFYKENPDSGADGRLIGDEARKIGLRCEWVPISSTGTFAKNSTAIIDWLACHRGKKIILVSLCKGGADVKFVLHSSPGRERFRDVVAWVNVCGTLNGSPVAEWLLASRPAFFVAWLYCKCRGHSTDFLRELAPSSKGHLSAPLELPPSSRMINVIGFPLQRHLTNPFMRQCYQRVSRQGPTDGGVLLADACRAPGVMYPVWGADHYLRPESRARKIMAGIFSDIIAARNPPKLCSSDGIPVNDQSARTSLA